MSTRPMAKDYYRILGVSKSADADEIKRAYRKLAREYHPDRNQGKASAEERFKEVQEAYDTLSDPARRAAYDRPTQNPFTGFPGTAGNPYGTGGGYTEYFGSEGVPFSSFGDIFKNFFAGAEPQPNKTANQHRSNHARHGQSVSTTLRLTFEQALQGGKTELRLPDGEVVRISIPQGVRNGFKIRLRGRGGASAVPGGRRGDLLVTFEVEDDPRFTREGNDLYARLTINAIEAITGTAKQILNPYGKKIKLTIPPGTQPQEQFRLKDQGIATDEGTGDLFVTVEVTIPRDLTPEQREVISQAARKAGLL